jgi:hypothetical protein
MNVQEDGAGLEVGGLTQPLGDAGPVEAANRTGFSGETEEGTSRFQQGTDWSPAEAFCAKPTPRFVSEAVNRLEEALDGTGSVGLPDVVSVFSSSTDCEAVTSIGNSRNTYYRVRHFAQGAVTQGCSIS